MKRFFTEHVEKIALAVVGFLGLLIVFGGFRQREGIDGGKSPEALRNEVTKATSHIESFKWDEHYRAERDLDQDLLERASETLRRVDSEAYVSSRVMKPAYHAPRIMRTDPEVFSAMAVQARAGFGTLPKRRERRNPFGSGQNPSFNQTNPDGEDNGRPIPTEFMTRMDGGRGGSNENGVQGTYFVAVTALIPYRKQVEEYLRRFQNADDFNPQRDLPLYINWTLERAEVVRGRKGRRWASIADIRTARENMRRGRDQGGMGRENEVIAPGAFLPSLTMPMPPGLESHELDLVACHDRVQSKEQYEEEMESRENDRRRRWRDREGMGSGSPRGPGGGGPEFRDGRQDGGRRERFEGGMPDGMQDGSGVDSGLAQDVMNPGFDTKRVPEYKMFRYFDFGVNQNRVYQYRLQLKLEDPNFPRNSSQDPPPSSLHDEVQARVVSLKAEGRRGERPLRETKVSEPSNMVKVEMGQRLLVGPVVAPRQLTVPGTGVTYSAVGTEAIGKAIAVEFDRDRAAELPLDVNLRMGSVAYAKGKVEPVLRWKGWLDKEEDRSVRVNQVVLDLRGGEELGVADLRVPGEMLIWDAARQQLLVRGELEDADEFPTFKFPRGNGEGMGDARPEGFRDGGMEGEGDRRNRRSRRNREPLR
ncbi:MAG TPA: hypothetical protein VIY86_12790 [Pirellulaceae bacterium]